jgi:hypothetical protein
MVCEHKYMIIRPPPIIELAAPLEAAKRSVFNFDQS